MLHTSSQVPRQQQKQKGQPGHFHIQSYTIRKLLNRVSTKPTKPHPVPGCYVQIMGRREEKKKKEIGRQDTEYATLTDWNLVSGHKTLLG